MLTNKLAAIATLAFAIGASAAPTVQAPAKKSLKDTILLADFRRSPINLDHDFREVPNTTITLKACTRDRRDATLRGTVMFDNTELTAAKGKDLGNLVQSFGNTLQTAFADQVKLFDGKDLKVDSFTNGFEGFGDVTKGASIHDKEKSGVTLTLIERQATVGGFNPACPKPKF